MIKIEALSKYYNQGKDITVKALDNVSLTINDGEFVSVIGKSGSGKSTLLHMIGGIDFATSGSIFFNDTDITLLSEKKLNIFRRENIGFVFQNYNLIPELNGEQNIRFPALLAKKEIDETYLKKLIDTLDITDRLEHLPSEMSGGQQQRIAIARAFINKPRLILCDEPTGNLDLETSNIVMQLIKNLHDTYGMTILLVTHDLDYANIADRVIELQDGKVIM